MNDDYSPTIFIKLRKQFFNKNLGVKLPGPKGDNFKISLKRSL